MPNDEEMCRRFERGLNDNIQKLVIGAREDDLTKLSELAQSMEALDSKDGTEKDIFQARSSEISGEVGTQHRHISEEET